ncbi:hypothetical protein WG922_13615, partial [Ramlibacter sp. AN1015]|uniref:hypothetical protein n=1 Tax=Ramlibacter sp. AN1015 TaxID=3133428 RepID=UPI0030C43ED1
SKVTGQISATQIAALEASKLLGTISTTQISDNAITTPKLVAGSVTASKLVLGDTTNLISDETFADNAYVQSTGGHFSIVTPTDPVGFKASKVIRYGTASLTTSASSNFLADYRPATEAYVPVTPGDQLLATFTMHTASNATGTAHVYVRFFAADKTTVLLEHFGITGFALPISTPTAFSSTVTVPDGARYMSYRVRRGGTGVNQTVTGWVEYGLIRVVRRVDAQLIVDGAITTSKLAAGSIEADKIKAGVITTSHFATGTLSAANIQAGTLGAGVVYAGSVAATQITAGSLASNVIYTGTLSADQITTGSMSAARITTGTLSADRISGGTFNAGTMTVTNLSASSITSGTLNSANVNVTNLNASNITSGLLTSDRIDTRGLEIKDLSGNVIFSSGISLAYSRVSGGPPSNATYGAQFGVNISGQITAANASTFIASAAIANAHIADAAVTNAKIGNLQVTDAKIADLNVTNAKIGNGAVTTLKIGLDAVTVPSGVMATNDFAFNPSYTPVMYSPWIDAEGGKTVVIASVEYVPSYHTHQNGDSGESYTFLPVYIRLVRNDGAVLLEKVINTRSFEQRSTTITYVEGARSGSTWYAVEMAGQTGYGTSAAVYPYVKHRTLVTIGAKR